MIINSKQNCIEDLSASIRNTSGWRHGLSAKYNDSRNGRAETALEKLSVEVRDLSEDQWAALSPFYSWSSGHWSDSVSQTARQVGFRNVDTLPAFVDRLVSILSQSVVV